MQIFASMLACTIHCRHLMVWKIFAPRFIYEGLQSYVIFGSICCAFALLVRCHWAINTLVTSISGNAHIHPPSAKNVQEARKAVLDKLNQNLADLDRAAEEKASAAKASDKTHND